MPDTVFYRCFACGADITAVVNSSGFYACPVCGVVQEGTPIAFGVSQPVLDTTKETKG